MEVDPGCVYLRLEPSVTLIDGATGDVRRTPGVELHWKSGNRWRRRVFTGNTLGAVLTDLGVWTDEAGGIDGLLRLVAGGA